MKLEWYCPGDPLQREEHAADQVAAIVNLVRLKRRRECEGRHDLVAILENGLADVLRAWDPPTAPVRH